MKIDNTKILTGSSELRSRLPHGAISRLAVKYRKSWTWIYNVISGRVNGNNEIINDAFLLAEIEDKHKQELNKAI